MEELRREREGVKPDRSRPVPGGTPPLGLSRK